MESEVCFGHVKSEMSIRYLTGFAVGIQESGFQGRS